MNAYDFDKTIYDGDSTFDFYFFLLKKQPRLWGTFITNCINGLKYKLGIIKKESFKEKFYQSFLPRIDSEKLVCEFWKSNIKKIKPWYLAQKQADDLIISAGSELLLKPICEQLGVSLIASQVCKKTGKLLGVNMYGEEKLRAFKAMYPNAKIENFYTDSSSDFVMGEMSANLYLVKRNQIKHL